MSTNKLGQYTLIIILILVSLLGCSQQTNELAGSNWELVSLNGKDLIEGTSISLEFTETYLGGEMSCNGYGGSPDTGKYISKSNGTFQLEHPFAVTVQLCTDPEGIMEQEAAYIEALKNADHFQVVENRLEFKDKAGIVTLVFQSK
jgi:heat shock protein HslJ